MRIHKEGYVTKSNQPYCHISLDANRTAATNGIKKFSDSTGINGHYFTTIKSNVGSHWNASNSKFTAPVTGVYILTSNICTHGSSPGSYMAWEWYKNGNRHYVGGWQQAESDGYERESVTTMLALSANDYIEPGYEIQAAVTFMGTASANAYYTSFSIALLH